MNMYKVTFEVETYIYAENEREAYSVAFSDAMEGVNEGNVNDLYASEINSITEVPEEWQDAFPYSWHIRNTEDKTIRELLEK